jgi:hypothetical protein
MVIGAAHRGLRAQRTAISVARFLTATVGLSVALAAGSAMSLAQELRLVLAGRPLATVVIAERPTGSAQLAAYELRHYVEKMSGAELPIVREPQAVEGTRILVGESAATRALGSANADLKPQEYVIRTFPDALLLMGRDKEYFEEVRYEDPGEFNSIYNAVVGDSLIGTCYAVHDFLENTLGVRWYYPNEEIGEVVPSIQDIAIRDLDIRRTPDAPVRGIYPLYTNSKRLYYTDMDEPEKFEASWVDPRVSLLYWIRNRYWGAMLYNANHSFDYTGPAFGESHPEWFSTKSYERMRQLNYQSEVQPCLTAPGFLGHVVQTARDYFDGKPEAFPRAYWSAQGNFFPIVPNDNTNMCGCEACRAQYRSEFGPSGNASHYVWGFLNRVAREVRQTHPEAMISGLAYFNYTVPPKGLVFEPNVAVTFCKFYTGYWDRNYQERDYRRITEYVNENRARFFVTWEYLCHPFLNRWPFPCVLPHVQADDVRRLSQLPGFMGGRPEFAYWPRTAQTSPVLDFMNLYWRMKLEDRFGFDFEGRLAEYYRGFFGPGGSSMEKFYTAIEDRWMRLGGGEEARAWWGKLGTREFLKELSGYIDQARQATAEGSLYRRRVDLVDAGILQYMLKARGRYEGSAAAEETPVGATAVARVVIPADGDWSDDATWTEAPDNVIEKTIGNDPVPQKTIFRLAYDDQHLYLKARMLEPSIRQIKATIRENDIGGFSDDSVELFLDPEGQGKVFYQFCINSLGAVYDARVDPRAIGATDTVTWDSGTLTRTAVGQDCWELRAAVPFAAFVKGPPQARSTWRFNLCRNRFVEPESPPFSAWSPTLGGFRTPERFGIVTFNAVEDAGKVLWNCGFDGRAFTTDTGQSPLIGVEGWYEDPSYANQGWDTSWRVVQREGDGVAICDVNATNPSTVVPMHAVRVASGMVSVEVDYRRLALANQPALIVSDAQGRCLGYLYAYYGRGDLVVLERSESGQRLTLGDDQHGLGSFSDPGRWFGLRLVIDTPRRAVTGYLRSGRGDWVRLNQDPLPYQDPQAEGSVLFLGFGTHRLATTADNTLEMDNVRVCRLP